MMAAFAKDRGVYKDPKNNAKPCKHGCGKTGRAGPMGYHEKYVCEKRASTVPPPTPVGAQERAAGGLRVSFEKVALRELPKFVPPEEAQAA